MMDKYTSSRTAIIVFKVPVREQKKMSHTMIRYSKQTRLSVSMAEGGKGRRSSWLGGNKNRTQVCLIRSQVCLFRSQRCPNRYQILADYSKF